MQPKVGEEAAPGSEWCRPSPRLCEPHGSSPPKVWTRQGAGLSDCVMATSVSTGQMVFPGACELMALQPGESFPKWSTLFTREQKSNKAPGCWHSENSCSACGLELAPCPHWLASHLLPGASLQVAAQGAPQGKNRSSAGAAPDLALILGSCSTPWL